jgi:hypothetical protein
MSECWNLDDTRMLAHMDKQELRAIAKYFRTHHGADSFIAALARARSLSQGGELETATVWNEIAEEISQIETSEALERCLKRSA